MQAVILVGGKGTRLSSLYADRPKPLVPIKGKPFLQWQLEWLAENGIRDVHLAAGHMGEQIEAWAASNPVTRVKITVSVETQRLGTGGGLKFVEPFIRTDPFFVLNGDSLAPNLDFQSLETAFQKVPTIGSFLEKSSNHWNFSDEKFQSLEKLKNLPKCVIAVTRVDEASQYGTVKFDEDGVVSAFLEKADRTGGWVNTGVYLMNKAVLDLVEPDINLSIEMDVFPDLVSKQLIYTTPCPPPLLDMGTSEGLTAMEDWLQLRKGTELR
ncbi:MAG: hypothetical protein EOL87_11805 [Spartobacteria bacterium]|nr:hypothetical protein [Spartobacteria bacterium]